MRREIELLNNAKKQGLAIPAFNVDNLESVLAVLAASRESKKPVIIQTIPKSLRYGGLKSYIALVKANDMDDNVAMHLDHGSDLQICLDCANIGYSSVMFDGSLFPFEENVSKTKQVCELVKSLNVAVEGELGTIGGAEENDEVSKIKYTEVNEAIEFIKQTGVDSLAIGVGTAHGVYKGSPHIAIDRIEEINKATAIPLVLHGASGLEDSVVKKCVKAGISKINFATELRQAFTRGVKLGFKKHPDVFDPKIYLPYAIEEIKNVALSKIRLCNLI